MLQHQLSSPQSQPTPSRSSSYLPARFRGEANKQAVCHISVSALQALPATRLKGQQPFCSAVHLEVMLILILTAPGRVAVFHFVATYHHNFIASPGEKINKSKTKSEIWADLEPKSVRPCHPYFNTVDAKHSQTHTFVCP